jgi:hypothetical protein
MSAPGPTDAGVASPTEPDLPPLGPALQAEIEAIKPVRTRVPARAALLLILAIAAIPILFVLLVGPRGDLNALPRAWVIGLALTWIAGALVPLLAATLPRRGNVLPDAGRAGVTATVVAAALLVLGLFATVDAPGATFVPAPTFAGFAGPWSHCAALSLAAMGPLLLIAGLVQRHLFPAGGVRIAAALGAAAGATAGLTLHLVCPIGGGLHVGLAHATGVTSGAVLGMLLLPRWLRS